VQNRLLIVAVVVLALLGGYVWWSSTREAVDEGPTLEEGETALFQDRESADLAGMTFGSPGKEVVLERAGDSNWLVGTDPSRPADDALAEAAARAAVAIVSNRQLEGAPAALADFGLGELAFGLTLRFQDGSSHQLRLGDSAPVGGGRYLLQLETGAVHMVEGWSLRPLERDPAEFRDRRLLPLDPDDVSELRLTRTGAPPLAMERSGSKWFVQAEPAWRVETGLVRDLLVDLVELRARDYLQPTDADDSFEPDVEVVVQDAAGASARLALGAAASDGLREARADGSLLPAAGERARVTAAFLDDLDPDPSAWRTFELLDFNPWIVDTIEHSAGGQTWRLEGREGQWFRTGVEPEVALDAQKVQDLLAELDGLRAVGYAPPDMDPSEAGVEQAHIELVQSDGERVGLTLYRGPNRDHVVVDGEPGLREVDATVHALIGHLRPLQSDAQPAATPPAEPEL
jgi:hypothetical protein